MNIEPRVNELEGEEQLQRDVVDAIEIQRFVDDQIRELLPRNELHRQVLGLPVEETTIVDLHGIRVTKLRHRPKLFAKPEATLRRRWEVGAEGLERDLSILVERVRDPVDRAHAPMPEFPEHVEAIGNSLRDHPPRWCQILDPDRGSRTTSESAPGRCSRTATSPSQLGQSATMCTFSRRKRGMLSHSIPITREGVGVWRSGHAEPARDPSPRANWRASPHIVRRAAERRALCRQNSQYARHSGVLASGSRRPATHLTTRDERSKSC